MPKNPPVPAAIYPSASDKTLSFFIAIANWVKRTGLGWPLAAANGTLGYFSGNRLSNGIPAVAAANALVQTGYYLAADAGSAAEIFKGIIKKPSSLYHGPYEMLTDYRDRGTSWGLLYFITLGFFLRVQGASLLFFHAVFETLRPVNVPAALSTGTALGGMQEFATSSWEGAPFFAASIDIANFLSRRTTALRHRSYVALTALRRRGYVALEEQEQEHEEQEHIDTQQLESTFLSFLQSQYPHIPLNDNSSDIANILLFFGNAQFQKNHRYHDRELRSDFYRLRGITRETSLGKKQHRFIKALVHKARHPFLTENMGKLLKFLHTQPVFADLNAEIDWNDDVEPFIPLTQLASTETFKSAAWNGSLAEAMQQHANEMDACHILTLLAKYADFENNKSIPAAEQLFKILIQDAVWNELIKPDHNPEGIAATLAAVFGFPAITTLPTPFQWHENVDPQKVKQEILTYLREESMEKLARELVTSHNRNYPHSKPSTQAILIGQILTQGMLSLYQLTIFAANAAVVKTIGALATEENASPATQEIIDTVSMGWGYLQLIIAIWSQPTNTFQAIAAEADKARHRGPSEVMKRLANEFKAHPFIILFCLIAIWSNIITWFSFATTLDYPKELIYTLGVLGLLCGSIASPTLLEPRLVTLFSNMTDDDQLIDYTKNLIAPQITREEDQKFKPLTIEAKHLALQAFHFRPAAVASVININDSEEKDEKKALGSSLKGNR